MPSYYKVLSAAVDDVLTRGFVSSTQITIWQARLKDAAEATFAKGSSESLERALQNVFLRLVGRNGILRYHTGLAPSVLDRLRPALANELTKFRLSSSAFLQARREEALLASLRRFSGWASSIPAGGVLGRQTALRAAIKKPLVVLPFEETRAIFAQSANLTVALNTLVSREAGAIAGCWHSRWRQPGYAYREDHKELDLRYFLFRPTWATEAGLVRGPWADHQPVPGSLLGCSCHYQFFYALEDLPKELLTAKGASFLKAAA